MGNSVLRTAAGVLLVNGAYSLQLNVDSAASIKSAASTIAGNVMQLYSTALDSDGIPGIFAKKYYWGEDGLAWDAMINYWALTGDSTYNDKVGQALLWQVGPQQNYLPTNWTSTEGNDDQSTWALAAMTAAENKFPLPAGSAVSSWLDLAINVFNSQVARWDMSTCGGGLRWQILSTSAGYNFKDVWGNGNLLQVSARLAHFTKNSTYSDWAEKVAQWSTAVGFVSGGKVFEGAQTATNCTSIARVEWTAYAGSYLAGYTYMANLSNTEEWTAGQTQLFDNIDQTFATTPYAEKDGVLAEISCSRDGISYTNCPINSLAYRGVLAQALAATKSMTNNATLREAVSSLIQTSAQGAAAQCSGGSSQTTCGSDWATSTWDGTQGLGQDLSALQIILALMSNSSSSSTSTSTGAGTATTSSTSTLPSNTGAIQTGQTATATPSSGADALRKREAGFALAVAGVAAVVIH